MFSGENLGVTASAEASGVVALNFDDFYAASAHRCLTLGYSLTGSWADAEDLVQDAYADAHRRWDEVGRYDDPAAWVRRAVINRSKSRWRRLRREVAALGRVAGRRVADGELVDRSHDSEFWETVRRLPRQQQRVVGLFYVEDLPVAQIAAALSCSEGTVKTHLSRARGSLHEWLTDPTSNEELTS